MGEVQLCKMKLQAYFAAWRCESRIMFCIYLRNYVPCCKSTSKHLAWFVRKYLGWAEMYKLWLIWFLTLHFVFVLLFIFHSIFLRWFPLLMDQNATLQAFYFDFIIILMEEKPKCTLHIHMHIGQYGSSCELRNSRTRDALAVHWKQHRYPPETSML